MTRRERPAGGRPIGGGGARNPRSLANLRPVDAAPVSNQRARTHGGYATVARERLDAKVREVFDALAADAPLRDTRGGLPRADSVAVRLLAECLCRLEDVRANVAIYGAVNERSGKVRPATDLEQRLRREAADYLDALGMTPRSRGKLGLDLTRAVDLSNAMSERDPDRRRVLMAEAGLPLDEENEDG